MVPVTNKLLSPCYQIRNPSPNPTEREKDRRGPYLHKVSDIKEIKGVKQVALLHGERRVAGHEECADVLQAQELQRQQWRWSVFGQFTC